MKIRTWPFTAFLMLLVAAVSVAEPYDWPGWRGPGGTGVSAETDWNPKCLQGGAKVLWTASIGAGYSNIAVAGGRVYAAGSGDATHLAFSCLDAASGKTIWKQNVMLGVGSQDPMSTPAVDGDRVYGLAQNGAVFCLQAADGSLVWKKVVGPGSSDDVRTFSLGYGCAASPRIDGALLFINANMAGVALDKMDGHMVWDSGRHIANALLPFAEVYATPVATRIDGKPAMVFLGPTALTAVDALRAESCGPSITAKA